jgi:hypothetical protein
MDRLTEQELHERAVEILERDLRREFLASYPEETIKAVARESIHELASHEVRIWAFVPVLARRTARRRLKAAPAGSELSLAKQPSDS